MTDIFLSEDVWYVALPGLGRVFVQERNRQKGRQVICRNCKHLIEPGEGFRFAQSRTYSEGPGSGYLCRVCITRLIRLTAKWHWNEVEGSLSRANGYTRVPIDGPRLADLFMLNGAAGLLAGVREALEERIKLVDIRAG